MNTIILVTIVLVLIFSFVILFGAPFLPTLKKTSEDAFELLDLKPGDTLLELGSGDGRILRMAAERGIRGIGYELNPLLVLFSQISCFRYRKLVSFKCRNYWLIKLPPCDGIYVFLLDKYMSKLDKKIMQEVKLPVKLVSHAFKIPSRNPARKKNALFLYIY
ncbi:hypothetical protein BH10PAT3_BH10PAT3_5110 [soil metagenome]